MTGRFGRRSLLRMRRAIVRSESMNLFLADSEIDSTRDWSVIEELILSFCQSSDKTTERNARMAQLFFHATEVFEGRRSQDRLLTALIKYFQNFSTKVVFFSDVKKWLSHLDTGSQKQLLVDTEILSQDLRPQPGKPEVSKRGQLS